MSVPLSPFVGLAAFTPRMAAYFTGRERFALTLAGAVLRSRVTVLYGQSGSGRARYWVLLYRRQFARYCGVQQKKHRVRYYACCISGAGTQALSRGCSGRRQQSSWHPGIAILPLP